IGTTTTLTATASSGLTVSYTTNGACTLSGTTLTYTATGGTCTVVATQPGDATYAAATPVTRTTTPVKNNQTITFANLPNSPKAATTTTTLGATASSGLPISYTATGSCTISGV